MANSKNEKKQEVMQCQFSLKTIVAERWLSLDEVAEMLMGVRQKSSRS